MSEQKEDEIVKLNIATLIHGILIEQLIEQLKANLQVIQKPKRISISWFGPQEIPLPKRKANALASALSEVLRKAWHLHSWGWEFSVLVRDEGQQWCVEVSTNFRSLDKDSSELNLARNLPELTFARNLVERELNGTIEVYPNTLRIRFPHYQPSSHQHLSSFWSSLLALFRRRRWGSCQGIGLGLRCFLTFSAFQRIAG